MLSMDEDLMTFKGKTFWVWEGNHMVIAWWHHIEQYYGTKIDWHFNVDCICLDPTGATRDFLDAKNDSNMLNFKFYGSQLYEFACCGSCALILCLVEFQVHREWPCWDKLGSKIHRIHSFGVLELHENKTLLRHGHHARCEKKHPTNSWYPLTLDMFVGFVYKVRIQPLLCIWYFIMYSFWDCLPFS